MKVMLGQVVLAGMQPRDAEGQLFKDAQGTPIKSPLGRLMDEAKEAKLCIRTMYEIAKLVKTAQNEMETFQELRNGLIIKYGEKDEKGAPRVLPTNPRWEEFQKDHKELMETEVELDVDEIVLPPEGQGIGADTLVALDGFVVMRGEEKPDLKIVKKAKGKRD